MNAREPDTVRPVMSPARRSPAHEIEAAHGAPKLEAIVRRCSAFGALAWLAYIGYLLRDCPTSGPICQPNNLVPAAAVALGLVIGGHVIARAATSVGGWVHAHRPAH